MDAAEDDLRLAGELARQAGQLALRIRSDGLSVRTKSSFTDLVTDADTAAEKLIVDRLATERPEDGVLAEEGSRRAGRRTWVIDPVDGTYNFVAGLPAWCSALALVEKDEPVLGAIYQPVNDELWLGGPHHPTTLNGAAIPALEDKPLSEVSVTASLYTRRLGPSRGDTRTDALLRAVSGAAVLRISGSSSVELSSVAGGRIGAYIFPNAKSWDWLPGAALVRAAGGVARVVEIADVSWHLAGSARTVADLEARLRR